MPLKSFRDYLQDERKKKTEESPSLTPAYKIRDSENGWKKVQKGIIGGYHPLASGHNYPDWEYGYVNHKNEFMSRQDAMLYARKNDLLRPGNEDAWMLDSTMLKSFNHKEAIPRNRSGKDTGKLIKFRDFNNIEKQKNIRNFNKDEKKRKAMALYFRDLKEEK